MFTDVQNAQESWRTFKNISDTKDSWDKLPLSRTDEKHVARGRSRVYSWLSSLFLREPNYSELKQTLDPLLLQAINNTFDVETGKHLSWLKGFAESLDATSATKLKETYNELFVVPIPGKYSPPFESCFREKGYTGATGIGEVFGVTTLQVKKFYERNGFILEETSIPQDHLGVELLFMAKLCSYEMESIVKHEYHVVERLRKEEFEFLDGHLCIWLPDFSERLKGIGKDDFYTHLALVTEAFTTHDREYLSVLTTHIKGPIDKKDV